MLIDTLRTRIRDAIFGRTQIKVVSISQKEDIVPVFLVGTFRSGTTLFRFLVDSHSQICCPPETKFLAYLAAMRKIKGCRESLEAMGLEEGYQKQRIRALASSFYEPYMVSKNKPLIVDKTPEYVRELDFIDWLYDGKCKYLLIFRNGLDVAHSMNSQLIEPLEGNKSVESAFAYWKQDTQIMLRWLEQRPEDCHKVVYDSLCSDVKGVMAGVFEFLGEEWEEAVQTWYDHRHDMGYEDIKARRQRSVSVSKGNYSQWDPELIDKLKREAADIHRAIGFDPDTLEYRGG